MFKDALGALSSSLVGAVKDTVSEYTPTSKNMGGAFTRIAQQGIANLSFRSPILADMAATMLHSFQMELGHREAIKQHTKSKESEEFREEIKSRLGDNADSNKVESEMIKVIQKMEKLIDKEGDKAESNEFYQQNEKFYKQFLTKITPQTSSSHSNTQTQNGVSNEVLTRIDVNTANTTKILADMQVGTLQTGQNVPSEAPKQATGQGFVDPYTGLPSIRAAIGGIGGQFLAKVFDDATLDKYAKKARRKFGIEKEETPIVDEPVIVKKEQSVTKVDEISDLETPKFEIKTIPKEAKVQQLDVKDILKDLSLDLTDVPSSEVSRENETSNTKKHLETKTLQEASLIQLQELNKNFVEKEESSGGILGSLKDMVGGFLPLVGQIAPMMSGIGSVLLKIAPIVGGVGLAAAGGLAVGTALKHTIDYGISKFVGKDETLGGLIYEATHPKTEDSVVAPRQITKPTDKANQIEKTEKIIEKGIDNRIDSKVVSPTILNSNTNNNSNTNVVIGNSVRNNESTFERVQSSNFWGPI